MTLTANATSTRNNLWPLFAKECCELLGYETMLPMNSDAEAVETAIKTARKWGYLKKGIAADKADIDWALDHIGEVFNTI